VLAIRKEEIQTRGSDLKISFLNIRSIASKIEIFLIGIIQQRDVQVDFRRLSFRKCDILATIREHDLKAK